MGRHRFLAQLTASRARRGGQPAPRRPRGQLPRRGHRPAALRRGNRGRCAAAPRPAVPARRAGRQRRRTNGRVRRPHLRPTDRPARRGPGRTRRGRAGRAPQPPGLAARCASADRARGGGAGPTHQPHPICVASGQAGVGLRQERQQHPLGHHVREGRAGPVGESGDDHQRALVHAVDGRPGDLGGGQPHERRQ